MSTTSSKSRIVLFLMIIIALVFFIASFMTATFSNGVNTVSTSQPNANISCIEARTAEEKVFGECSYS